MKMDAGWERVASRELAPVIVVTFGGVYPAGSDGNAFAKAMAEFLRSALRASGARGVVIDLTALTYEGGDAIGALAIPLLLQNQTFRPAAIVATGRSAAALRPLLSPGFALGIAHVALTETKEHALVLVERELVGVLKGAVAMRRAAAGQPPATPDLPSLIDQLGHKDRVVQQSAAAQLGAAGDRAAIVPLLDAFERTPHVLVREAIVSALAQLGHPIEALAPRIEVFDPMALVRCWVEDGPERGPLLRIPATLAANFRREGVSASDRLADVIAELLGTRSERIVGALQAVTVDIMLTPKLEAVLREVSASPWIDFRLRERATRCCSGRRS